MPLAAGRAYDITGWDDVNGTAAGLPRPARLRLVSDVGTGVVQGCRCPASEEFQRLGGAVPVDEGLGCSRVQEVEDLQRQGAAKAIGVSNFYSDRLVDLIDHNEITPAVNQIETNTYFQRIADQQRMRERGVQIESWAPFAEGRDNLFTDQALQVIADAHGKSVAQVILRWLMQRDVVVNPKSVRRERMAENFDIFDFELTAGEMDRIAAMDTGQSQFFDHHDPAMVSQLGKVRVT